MRAQSPFPSFRDTQLTGFVVAGCFLISMSMLTGCSSSSEPRQQSESRDQSEAATSPQVTPEPPVASHRDETLSIHPKESASSSPSESSPSVAAPDLPTNNSSTRAGEGRNSNSKVSGSEVSSGSPEKALTKARILRDRVATAQRAQKFGEAFGLATQALEAVQEFPANSECKACASELIAELETLSRNAGAQTKAKAADSTKTLIEQ